MTVPASAAGRTEAPRCPALRSEIRGELPPPLTELSGWALSRANRDVLWGHNDADDGSRIYAVSALDGSLLAEVEVTGVTEVDWEDIATSTDADGRQWIIVADTGDNAERRESSQLILIPEPELSVSSVAAAGVVTLRWADGPHDVETLILDPVSGDAILIGKRFSDSPEVPVHRIAAASLTPGTTVIAESVGMFEVPDGQEFGPTGGSIDVSGTTIGVLFSGDLAMTWTRQPGVSVVDTILGTTPCTFSPGSGKYESLAIGDNGTRLVATEGRSSPVVAYIPDTDEYSDRDRGS